MPLLLRIFLLERALYELEQETRRRPERQIVPAQYIRDCFREERAAQEA